MLGNAHGVNMLMTIPQKTASQHFTLHKLVVFLTRVVENKFIEYVHDFIYHYLSFNHRDFTVLKETDLQHCSAGILTVRPLNVPLYDAKVSACEANCTFRCQEKNQYVEGNCFYTTVLCTGTPHVDSSTFQSSVRPPYVVRMDSSG